MTRTGHDPIERFVDDTVQRLTHRTPVHDGAAAQEPRFIPLTPFPGGAAVLTASRQPLAELAARHPPLTSLTSGPLHLLTELTVWTPALLAACGVCAGVDGIRWAAHRHRVTLANQVRMATTVAPRRVHVPWPPGLWTVRRAVVVMERGAVITRGRRFEDLAEAIERGAGPRWAMSVEWVAQRHRIVVTRRRPAADLAADSVHAPVLGAALANSQLEDARIVEVLTDPGTGVEIGYRVRYKPMLNAGKSTVQATLREAILAHLTAHESGRIWTVAFLPEIAQLQIGLAAPLPTYVPHLALPDYDALPDDRRYLVPFATGPAAEPGYTGPVDAQGRILACWDISPKSSAPHVLIVGATGGGKTVAIRTLCTEAILRGVPVLAADLKMIELDGFEQWGGVAAIVYHLREIVEMIVAVYEEMMARREHMHRTRMAPGDLPAFAFFMDEFFILSALIQRAVRYKGNDPEQIALTAYIKNHDPLGKIAEILALIRSLRGVIGLGVQRPDGRNFGDDSTSVRDNFKTRISLSNLSMQGSLMMWGDAEIGRDLDTSIPGRATVTAPNGMPITAQVHWTPDVDAHPAKWARLSQGDRDIVTALRPVNPPRMTCFSVEMATLVMSFGHDPIVPDGVGFTSEEIAAGLTVRTPAAASHDVAGVTLDYVDDAIPAARLVVGDRILVSDPDSGENILAAITSLRRRRPRGHDEILVADLAADNRARVHTQVEFAPDELVLLAPTPDSA
jgi:hypothetical protein